MSTVPPPDRRSHDDYFDNPAWTVVDVDRVDKVFATRTGDAEVRLDLDGRAHPSCEAAEPDAWVNLSIWLTDEQLEEIVARVA